MHSLPVRCLPRLLGLVLLIGSLVQTSCRQEAPNAETTVDSAKGDDSSPASGANLPPVFTDVTRSSGIHFQYRNGEEANKYTMLETLGGGVALIDYDRDGKLDIFITGGGYFDGEEIKGYPCRLYHNEGNWKFRDVTAEMGLDPPLFYSHGVAVGDYDNDGWPDLLVTGYGRLALFHNEKGQRFVEVTKKAGLMVPRSTVHWSTSAAWADLTGDGRLDLFVCHYVDWSFQNHIKCSGYQGVPVDVCGPEVFKALPQQLFLNNGDGTFREASQQIGLVPAKGLGVLVVDLNDDGKPDIFVANDGIYSQLYVNQGGGKFLEKALAAGVAGEPNGSMGVDAADFEGNGRFSLLVTNFQQQSHALYENLGKGLFSHASARNGITAIGRNFTGWGGGFFDFDRDGNEDLIIAHGHVFRHPVPPEQVAQRAVLMENVFQRSTAAARVRFEDISYRGGDYFKVPHRGRGVAIGDLDNDGRLDLVISHNNEPVVVLRNTLDNGNHWLGVELVGQKLRDAVGAKLVLEAGGRKLVRSVKGGGSYASANDQRVVFGLNKMAGAERLTVHWPSGRIQVWEGAVLGVDQYLRLFEGEPRPRHALRKNQGDGPRKEK